MSDSAPPAGTRLADLDETATAVALRDAPAPAGMASAMKSLGLPGPEEWAALTGMAEQLSRSDLVSKALQGKPANVMLVFLKGRDVGISPTTALSMLHVVDGKVGMAAELMSALVRRAGYKLWPDPANDRTKAVAHAIRDGEQHSFTFDLEDATVAGLCTIDAETGRPRARSAYGKPLPWENYPQFLLWARAVSGLCRMVFSDILMGIAYTPEELGAYVNEQGVPIDVPVGDQYRAAGDASSADLAARAEAEAAERDAAAREHGWNDNTHSAYWWETLIGQITEEGPVVGAAVKEWKRSHPGKSLEVFLGTVEMVHRFAAENVDDQDPLDDSPEFAARAGVLLAQRLAEQDAAAAAPDPEPAATDATGPDPAVPEPQPDPDPAVDVQAQVAELGKEELIAVLEHAGRPVPTNIRKMRDAVYEVLTQPTMEVPS